MAEGTIGCARGIAEDIMSYCQINILEKTLPSISSPYIELIKKNHLDFFGASDFNPNALGKTGLGVHVDDDLLMNRFDLAK